MLIAGCQWQQKKTVYVDSMFFLHTESQKNTFSGRSDQLCLTVNHCYSLLHSSAWGIGGMRQKGLKDLQGEESQNC
jgi:hypothetical protein